MNWKKNSIFLLSIIICCIPIFLTFNRGINYFDEGYILEGARRIVAGELPYRDFHFIYTPGVIYFLALFLRLFGNFLIVERFAALFMSIIGIIFLGLFTRKLTKNIPITLLSMLSYAVWGPAHLNFVWPVMIVIPLVFIYLFFILRSHFFLAGLVMGIILLCKHNFGAALLISLVGYILFIRLPKRQIVMIFSGFTSVMLLFLTYLLTTHSFFPFFSDMNTYTIQEIFVRKAFSVPFPTQNMGKSALYAFPGIVSFIVSIGLLMQKKHKHLLIPFTVFFFYLFGIFPTPDWTHLTPLISITGLLFALVSQICTARNRFISYFFMISLVGIGLYSGIVRNYYRWEASLKNHTHCFSSGSMKYMCIDEKNYAVISQTLKSLEKETKKDKYIFSSYHNAIYYFFTQKNNPTRHIEVPQGTKEEDAVVHALKQKKVSTIITRFPLISSKSKIVSSYIEKNYVPVYSVYEFTVWKRKK